MCRQVIGSHGIDYVGQTGAYFHKKKLLVPTQSHCWEVTEIANIFYFSLKNSALQCSYIQHDALVSSFPYNTGTGAVYTVESLEHGFTEAFIEDHVDDGIDGVV